MPAHLVRSQGGQGQAASGVGAQRKSCVQPAPPALHPSAEHLLPPRARRRCRSPLPLPIAPRRPARCGTGPYRRCWKPRWTWCWLCARTTAPRCARCATWASSPRYCASPCPPTPHTCATRCLAWLLPLVPARAVGCRFCASAELPRLPFVHVYGAAQAVLFLCACVVLHWLLFVRAGEVFAFGLPVARVLQVLASPPLPSSIGLGDLALPSVALFTPLAPAAKLGAPRRTPHPASTRPAPTLPHPSQAAAFAGLLCRSCPASAAQLVACQGVPFLR